MKDLSVIVPTKDEATAPRVIAELYRVLGRDTEVIVVDKSSPKMRKPLERTGARIIEQMDNGYTSALMEGFKVARGKVLATIDADGTYSAGDLKRIVEELRSGNAAWVSGNRFAGRAAAGSMGTSVKVGNSIISFLFNSLNRSSMHDVLSGAFAIKREAFDSMRDEDPSNRAGTLFFEIELKRRGYKLKEVPISYGVRADGTTGRTAKVKPILGVIIAYRAIRFARDYQPLLIFGGIGVLLCILGLALGAFVFSAFLHAGTLTEPGRALIAFMLVTLGFLSIAVGLILDLLLEIERKVYKAKEK